MGALSSSDLEQVTVQLEREPQTDFEVVARCAGGHPLVIRNHPVDHEGDPFPTLYWLTCPEAVKAVSRLESAGWIKRLDAEAELQDGLELAHREYAAERERLAPGAGAWGGVGGTARGIKCLHAHYANHLAGGDDPVGRWVAERVEPVHPDAPTPGPAYPGPRTRERVAAVDMGTNSIRLLVAEPAESGGIAEVARDMVITRLGTGVDRTHRLDPAALDRTMEVLGRYARRARALGATRIRVGATSAVRDAENRDDLFRRVEELTGVPPELLPGEAEGRLSFLGATSRLDVPGPLLVFDIGGGSTELALGDPTTPPATISVDVGSVRLTERVRPDDPPTPAQLEEMARLADEGLAPAEATVPPGRAATLVGVAGTTTTVQALALGLPRYDPDAIHGSVLTREAAERATRQLAAMTTAERRALPFMASGREDVIVAGAQILLAILRRWGFESCVVSERDILDGLALEMVETPSSR